MSKLINLNLSPLNLSIRTKLFMAITLLMGLIAIFISVYFPQALQERALQAIASKAQSISEMTAYSAGPSLFFDDLATLEESFDVARQNPDLVYLVVTDSTGAIVAAFKEETARQAEFRQGLDGCHLNAAHAVCKATAPILVDGQTMGHLYLGLSLAALRADVRQSRHAIAWLSLMLFLVGMGLVFGISTVITGPLGQITRTVDQIADGDLSQRAQVQSQDEVGHLAGAFNRMVDKLEHAHRDLETLNQSLGQQQEALRKAHDELEDRVRQRTADLEAAMDELRHSKELAEAATRAKSAFLANMSHEIRTPLSGILGLAEILGEEIQGVHREFAGLISHSGRRLLDTLNSVLDLARLDAGKLAVEPEALHVAREVDANVRLLQALADAKGLALTMNNHAPEAWALLDASCLSRIINNLVGNALKFTERGSVTVTVTAEAQRVFIRVNDTGIGIAAAFLPYLFDEFRQESTGEARSHEGSGLGLAITKRLTELMGGSISVERRKGEGSTFTVSFSLSAPPQVPESVAPVEAASVLDNDRQARVLVVEDSQEVLRIIEHVLQPLYCVDMASSVEEALRLVKQARYDVVLLDINLGGGTTGLDVLGVLQGMPSYAQVPMIAMTAYALSGDRERFLEAGFDYYLPKPFPKQVLLAMLKQALSSQPLGQRRRFEAQIGKVCNKVAWGTAKGLPHAG